MLIWPWVGTTRWMPCDCRWQASVLGVEPIQEGRVMRVLLTALILAASGIPAVADNLCSEVDSKPTAEGTRMPEDTFEVPAGLDAADKLQAYLNQEKIEYDFGQVINSFVAKGVILRQQALAASTSLELAEAKQAAGKANADDVAKAEAEAKKGLEAFCGFMVNAVVAE
jgi:hypothetical protein